MKVAPLNIVDTNISQIIDSNSTKDFDSATSKQKLHTVANEESKLTNPDFKVQEEGWYSRKPSTMDIARQVGGAFEDAATDNIVAIADGALSTTDGFINGTLDYVAGNNDAVSKTHAQVSNLTTGVTTSIAEYVSATQEDPAKPLKDTFIVGLNVATKTFNASKQWEVDFDESVRLGQGARFLTESTVNAGFVGVEIGAELALGFAGAGMGAIKVGEKFDLSEMFERTVIDEEKQDLLKALNDINSKNSGKGGQENPTKIEIFEAPQKTSQLKPIPNADEIKQKYDEIEQEEYTNTYKSNRELTKDEKVAVRKSIEDYYFKSMNQLEKNNRKKVEINELLSRPESEGFQFSDYEPSTEATIELVDKYAKKNAHTETQALLELVADESKLRGGYLDAEYERLEGKITESMSEKLADGTYYINDLRKELHKARNENPDDVGDRRYLPEYANGTQGEGYLTFNESALEIQQSIIDGLEAAIEKEKP